MTASQAPPTQPHPKDSGISPEPTTSPRLWIFLCPPALTDHLECDHGTSAEHSWGEIQLTSDSGVVILRLQGEVQPLEELLELSVLENMVGQFQERKGALLSFQVPLMVQVKVRGAPATRISRTWSSGFCIWSEGKDRLD